MTDLSRYIQLMERGEALRRRGAAATAALVATRVRLHELIQESVDVIRMFDQVQHSKAIPLARLNHHPLAPRQPI